MFNFGYGRHRRNTPVATPAPAVDELAMVPYTREAVVPHQGPNLADRINDYMDAMRDLREEVPQGAPAAQEATENPADAVDDPVAMEIPHFKDSWWKQVKRAVSRFSLLCCCQGDTVASWDYERAMKRNVRHEMMTTLHPVGERSVREQVVADVERLNAQRVHHIPRLVVEVVVALRCKLGMGSADRSVPGNVSVVRAEAAKMLRDWNVRAKDAAAHLVEIERCFFEDDSHYKVSTWRARGVKNSRFFRWFIGASEPVGFDY